VRAVADAARALADMLSKMAQSDRQIPASARCSACDGAGWKWWSAEGEVPGESKWIVCRECIGTGRSDQNGRKRLKPSDPPDA
jgi:DnaJ-class molecular chaperone